MTSPVGGLIQTIFKLQELRQRDEAAQLAREQFGLEQTKVGLTQQQMAEQGISLVQNLAENSKDPSQFLQHVPFLSRVSGTPEDVLRTTLQSTPPSAATTRSAAVAAGAQSAGGTLDRPAAVAALTGGNEAELAKSGLDASLLQGAQSLLGTLDPAKKAALNAQVLQRTANGMSLKDASLDVMFANSPAEVRNQAMKIGLGLAPSADAALQARLGFQKLALDTSVAAFEQQKGTLQMELLKAEADAKLKNDPDKHALVGRLLNNYDQAIQDWISNSSHLTPQGQILKAQSVNAIGEELVRVAPEIYGKGGTAEIKPIKPGESAAATSEFLKYFSKIAP